MSDDLSTWSVERISNVADIVLGGTPSTAVGAYWGGDIPWMSSGDVHAKRIGDVAGRITQRGLASSNAQLVDPPAVAIALAGQGKTRGTVAFVQDRLSTNQSVALIRPRDNRLDARYLFHNLDSRYEELRRQSMGDGRAGLSAAVLGRLIIEFPPRPEQFRLANILDSLDTRISASKRAIAKLRRVQEGLVNELIGSHQPNRLLGEALVGNPSNGIYKPENLIGRGTLLVGQTAFTADRRVDPGLARRAVVSSNELVRFGIIDGDILVSRVFATLEGVGQPAVVGKLEEPAVFESNMMRLRCRVRGVSSFFIFESLTSSRTRAFVTSHANLSGQASISQDVVSNLPIWLPTLDEQEAVVTVLSRVRTQIEIELKLVKKLVLEKRGLADALLFPGRRNPVIEISA